MLLFTRIWKGPYYVVRNNWKLKNVMYRSNASWH